MNRRSATLVAIGALVLIAGAVGAGYLLGRSGATTEEEASRVRAEARQRVLANGRTAERKAIERFRERGVTAGRKRGRAPGAKKGQAAGEAKVASSATGPTPLPPPQLPTDITVPSLAASTLAERPSEVVLGNHSLIEAIAWSAWGGDVAEGSGTLVGVECEPSCAEGPVVRHPISVKAWEPSFTPDNARYYSKLTMLGPETGRFTVDVQAY